MLPTSDTWDPDLDAVIAAPNHHRVLLENDRVRVLETRVLPGETVPLHTHQFPAVTHFVSCSDFVRRNENGEVLVDSKAMGLVMEPGQAVWTPPLGPHTLENVGDTVILVLVVEIKSP